MFHTLWLPKGYAGILGLGEEVVAAPYTSPAQNAVGGWSFMDHRHPPGAGEAVKSQRRDWCPHAASPDLFKGFGALNRTKVRWLQK